MRKRDGAIISSQIGAKEHRIVAKNGEISIHGTSNDKRVAVTLTEAQLQDLATLLVRIEETYGAPQDVEWCFDGRQWWIVQSRPVTTVSSTSSPDIEWTRANLREILPELPSPQTIQISCDNVEQGWHYY